MSMSSLLLKYLCYRDLPMYHWRLGIYTRYINLFRKQDSSFLPLNTAFQASEKIDRIGCRGAKLFQNAHNLIILTYIYRVIEIIVITLLIYIMQ